RGGPEPRLEALQPYDRRTAISVDIRDDVAVRHAARRFSSNDQALHWFIDDRHAGNGLGPRACVVGTRVVDDEDFVGRTRLRAQRVKTGGKQGRFVVRADDHGDRQTRLSPRSSISIDDTLAGWGNALIAPRSR